MNTNASPGNGTPAASTVGVRPSADNSARPLSESPEAKRKREARATRKATTSSDVGGRGGSEPRTKGNPIPPGPHAVMGEPLSASEAKEQLLYAHIGIAKVIRSEVDFDELDEEFTVAGKNYAHVANHIWPPLRVVIRFVAPVVLVAVLLVIWGHMIAATPWVGNIRDWWQRRRADEEQPVRPHVVQDASPSHSPAPPPAAPEVPSPPIPPRPRITRRLSHRL